MYLKRVSHLKRYILEKYPQVLENKMDILKIGQRMYIVMVTRDGYLLKEKVFVGPLESVNDLAPMKKIMDANIYKALDKAGYILK